jgi:hypothetical protein
MHAYGCTRRAGLVDLDPGRATPWRQGRASIGSGTRKNGRGADLL